MLPLLFLSAAVPLLCTFYYSPKTKPRAKWANRTQFLSMSIELQKQSASRDLFFRDG